MEKLIVELKELKGSLDTLIWVLSGEAEMAKTVKSEIDTFSFIPEDIQTVFNQLLEAYGDVELAKKTEK